MWLEDAFIREGRYRDRVVEPDEAGPRLEVVRVLEKKSILRLDPKIDSTWYELAHDRLVAPFQGSNRRWFAKHKSVPDFMRLAREYCYAGKPKTFKTVSRRERRQWEITRDQPAGKDPLGQASPCEQDYCEYCKKKTQEKQRWWYGSGYGACWC